MVVRAKINDLQLQTRHKDITPGNHYRVIQVTQMDFRIMSDDGQPYIYARSFFDLVRSYAVANLGW